MSSPPSTSRIALVAAVTLGALLAAAVVWRPWRSADAVHAAECADPLHRWHEPDGDCSCISHDEAAARRAEPWSAVPRRSALDTAAPIESD